MIENNVEKKQRAVLVAVDTGEYDAQVSLDELEELAVTCLLYTSPSPRD